MRNRCVALVSAMLVMQAAAAAAQSKPAAPRISPVPEREWTDAQRAVVSKFGSGGSAANDLGIYLHHPVLAQNIMPFERYISSESTLSPRHRELLILRTAWLC